MQAAECALRAARAAQPASTSHMNASKESHICKHMRRSPNSKHMHRRRRRREAPVRRPPAAAHEPQAWSWAWGSCWRPLHPVRPAQAQAGALALSSHHPEPAAASQSPDMGMHGRHNQNAILPTYDMQHA